MRYMCNGLVHFSAVSNSMMDNADIISTLAPAKPKYIRNKNIPTQDSRNLETEAVTRSARKYSVR